jgi:hypothetical protein
MQPNPSPKQRTTSWKEGQSGNPSGRPPGARNRGSYELRERLKARGDKDPAEFLSDIISSSNASTECKIAASNALMPYYHSKLGATPVEPAKIYLEIQIQYPCPDPKTMDQVNSNIWHLNDLMNTGLLDREWGVNLINVQRAIGNNIIDQCKLITAQGDPNAQQIIKIEGGLPQLPGTNITMPMNGHEAPINAPPSDHPDNQTKPST